MANEKLKKAVDGFVLERMNVIGMEQPDTLDEAY